MQLKWMIPAVCLCFACATAIAGPKDKPRKGKPADQAALDLTATLTNDAETKADGNITDWDENNGTKVEFKTLLAGEYEYDWTGPKDLSGSVMAQYSAERIYFLIQVRDNAVVAKRRQWKSDRVELWLAPESADGKSLGGPRGILLDVGPQVDGGKASVKWLSGKPGGVDATAFVSPVGYDFEVAVDYAALGKSPVMDGAMRYCVLVRDWDQDDPNEDEAAIGTCPINPAKSSSIKPAQMGKIPLHFADELWKFVITSDTSLPGIREDWKRITADLGGDAHPEIIASLGGTVLFAGTGFAGPGTSLFRIDLEAKDAEDVQISARDINGDKRNEAILRRTEACAEPGVKAVREYVFRFDPAAKSIQLLTNYVTEIRAEDGRVAKNSVQWKKTAIVQTLDKKSADIACTLSGTAGMVPILLPADGVKSRTVPVQ